MIRTSSYPGAMTLLALLGAMQGDHGITDTRRILMGETAVFEGAHTGASLTDELRILTRDPGGSGTLTPGTVLMLHHEGSRSSPGWHPFGEGIFGAFRAVTYIGKREAITVKRYQVGHRTLDELLYFGLMIDRDNLREQTEYKERFAPFIPLLESTLRGRKSGGIAIAQRVTTTKDRRGRHNVNRFGLSLRAIQRRLKKVEQSAQINVVWANRSALALAQIIDACESIIREAHLAIRQAMRAPWMQGEDPKPKKRWDLARSKHWPSIASELEMICIAPLNARASLAAIEIRAAAQCNMPNEAMEHLHQAYKQLSALLARFAIAELQLAIGYMKHGQRQVIGNEIAALAPALDDLRGPSDENKAWQEDPDRALLTASYAAISDRDLDGLYGLLKEQARRLDTA